MLHICNTIYPRGIARHAVILEVLVAPLARPVPQQALEQYGMVRLLALESAPVPLNEAVPVVQGEYVAVYHREQPGAMQLP